jgi:hypothetical protein
VRICACVCVGLFVIIYFYFILFFIFYFIYISFCFNVRTVVQYVLIPVCRPITVCSVYLYKESNIVLVNILYCLIFVLFLNSLILVLFSLYDIFIYSSI